MKFLVALAFLGIIASLASALFFMMKGSGRTPDGQPRSGRMVRALALRVGLSVVLFICILVAWKLGYIHPTGIPPGK